MKIQKIHLINFKRFRDLRLEHIPNTSKLVLLIGSNGSGKSSVFDAFGFFDGAIKQDIPTNEAFWSYFKKNQEEEVKVRIIFDNQVDYTVSHNNYNHTIPQLSDSSFYGRTSFRQISRLSRTTLGQGEKFDFEKDSDRPKFFIDRDNRFENDVEKITEIILKDFFRSNQSNEQIRQKYINPINSALQNVFGHGNGTKLELLEIIPPLEGKTAQITFRKGTSEFHYNYLSAGEKEVFNLFINFLSRTSLYKNTIFYLDEIDLHLNTKIQFHLLKELTENWIPDNCQLWTASHSLGFIEYAKQSEWASIIDFDDLDFDLPTVLVPEAKDNPEVYEIAVGKEFLPSLFKDKDICFVENKDSKYYAQIGLPKVFVPENNRNGVYHKVRTGQHKGMVDRDFLSDDDMIQIRKYYPNLYILNYYSIENYLYHPDNLEEYYLNANKPFDKSEYMRLLTEAKNLEKDNIIPNLSLKRTEYAYFGESQYNGKALQNRFKNKSENTDQSKEIVKYLNSNDFETFYKSLPMKTYCTQLPQRQNLSKSELSKTTWFKKQIERLLTGEQ